MRRTRLALAAFSMTAAVMVLGAPAATAASLPHQPAGDNPVQVVPDGARGDDGGSGARGDDGGSGARGDEGGSGARGDEGGSGAQGDEGGNGARGDEGGNGAQGDEGGNGAQGDEGGDPAYAHPVGAVPAGDGGSATVLNTSEVAAGGSLAALGLVGCIGVMRRRSSH